MLFVFCILHFFSVHLYISIFKFLYSRYFFTFWTFYPFCTFILCNLVRQSILASMQNLKSVTQKWLSYYYFVLLKLKIIMFVLCLDNPDELPCEIWSLQLKKWSCFAQFSILWCPAPPPASNVFEGFQIGSPSPLPDISRSKCPTNFVHPSKCCYQRGDSFRSSPQLLG